MTLVSSHLDVTIPPEDLPTYFFNAVRKTVFGQDPDLPFLVSEQKTLTFAEMEALTLGLASGLANNAGLARGDTILLVLPNTVYYSAITLAAQMLGAAVATVNPLYTVRELADNMKLCSPKMVVTVDDKVTDIKAAVALAESEISEGYIFTLEGENALFDLLSAAAFPRVQITTEEEAASSVAAIVFSSGTGGKPKGIMLSHRNIVANIVQNMAAVDSDKLVSAKLAETDGVPHMIAITPFFHIYGFTCHLHLHLCQGLALVVMPRFSLETFCQLVQRHRARTAHIVPPIILALTKDPAVKKYDLSSIAYVTSGAAPLTKELHLEAQRTLGFPVIQDYGMSESSPVLCRVHSGETVYGSAGRLLPNIMAKVVDDDGKEVEAGEVGELCFRGPNIMLGYLSNPVATAESIDVDGYLHTGDIGYIDCNGNIFITDRKKELIKYKGFQVAPAELEGLLLDHPAVLDCAVIGVYDELQATELPKGFIVIRSEANTASVIEDIQQWLSSRVIYYKKLRGGIEVVESIPKSPTGKILRRILRDREAQKK